MEHKERGTCSSGRLRKQPVTRNKDFYGQWICQKCVLVPTVSDDKVCSFTNNTTNPLKENKEETSTSCLKSVNNKVLKVFHQNIRGLRNKINELLCSLHPVLPHILCLTEHHMTQLELDHVHIENFKLGAKYCRKI
jgi:hypothetical protein